MCVAIEIRFLGCLVLRVALWFPGKSAAFWPRLDSLGSDL